MHSHIGSEYRDPSMVRDQAACLLALRPLNPRDGAQDVSDVVHSHVCSAWLLKVHCVFP